jgi:hypothetical protein
MDTVKSKALGWTSKHDVKHFMAHIEEETAWVVEHCFGQK